MSIPKSTDRKSNDTHRKRLARALAATEGIGYQTAQRRVEAAARDRMLPTRMDQAGMALALAIIHVRGEPTTRRLAEVVAAASCQPSLGGTQIALSAALGGYRDLWQQVELLVRSCLTASAEPGAFEQVVTDIGKRPPLERSKIAYFVLGVAEAVASNYRTYFGPDRRIRDRAMNDVLYASRLRCPNDVRAAFDTALSNPPSLPWQLTEDPKLVAPAVQCDYFNAHYDHVIEYILEACDHHVGMNNAWVLGPIQAASSSQQGTALQWLYLTVNFAAAVAGEVAERTGRDPVQLLARSLTSYDGENADSRAPETVACRDDNGIVTRLDSVLDFTLDVHAEAASGDDWGAVEVDLARGTHDAASVLSEAFADADSDPLKPVLSSIDVQDYMDPRPVELLFGLHTAVYLMACCLVEGGGAWCLSDPREGWATEVEDGFVRTDAAYGSPWLDMLRPYMEVGYIWRTVHEGDWRANATALVSEARVGLRDLSAHGVDPQVVLEALRRAAPPSRKPIPPEWNWSR